MVMREIGKIDRITEVRTGLNSSYRTSQSAPDLGCSVRKRCRSAETLGPDITGFDRHVSVGRSTVVRNANNNETCIIDESDGQRDVRGTVALQERYCWTDRITNEENL